MLENFDFSENVQLCQYSRNFCDFGKYRKHDANYWRFGAIEMKFDHPFVFVGVGCCTVGASETQCTSREATRSTHRHLSSTHGVGKSKA